MQPPPLEKLGMLGSGLHSSTKAVACALTALALKVPAGPLTLTV